MVIKRHEVDLTEILSALWRAKLLIVFISLVFSVAGVFYALSLPNVYRATAILAPVENEQGGMLSGLKSEFGGLAAMAGVNLGGGKSNKAGLALQILQSRAFLNAFVEKYNLKAKLLAAQSWDLPSNSIVYKEKLYDEKTGSWRREVKPPMQVEPNPQEVFEHVMKKNISVVEESDKGIVKLSASHYSPELAKFLVDHLVLEINQYMKQNDIAEAEAKIAYLQSTLQETVVADMQRIFYQLIEQQEQTKMLAKTQAQYVFKVIDPAIEPQKKDAPKRALICIGFSFFGFILVVAVVLFRHFVTNKAK
ncbi:LPS O-antigen length regulator [Pseudoalteromonas sp. S16_S37]|nr:LPS O-antigen length regulator [Pseudoalteromonas sp. S16_S37]